MSLEGRYNEYKRCMWVTNITTDTPSN